MAAEHIIRHVAAFLALTAGTGKHAIRAGLAIILLEDPIAPDRHPVADFPERINDVDKGRSPIHGLDRHHPTILAAQAAEQ